jgi:uracil-DNA glycosylase
MGGDWAASALKWWEDAGVDTIVAETPRNWLAPAPAAAPRQPVASAVSEPALAQLPDTLGEFQAWLLEANLPVAAASAARVGPVGDAASGLMVLIDMPSDEDVAAGYLLSGEPGALFDRMMQAIGHSRDSLYLASMSPARTATATFDEAAAARLATVARHHVGLVAPKALLLFGDACAKALLGGPVAQTRGKWHELDTPGGKISTLVTMRPEKLVSQPGLKKYAWEDLQVLREGPRS